MTKITFFTELYLGSTREMDGYKLYQKERLASSVVWYRLKFAALLTCEI